jgi:hypothetical protein
MRLPWLSGPVNEYRCVYRCVAARRAGEQWGARSISVFAKDNIGIDRQRVAV